MKTVNGGKRLALIAALLAALWFAAASAAADDRGAVRSAYAQVDDIRIYYEVRGAGEPILMLHGAFGSAANWATCADILARRYMVVTPDARGRGRTGDGDGPISPGRTARDVVGLMDHLGLRQAHVVGHSAGSLTTIGLLVDYPDRVKSATLVGSPFIAFTEPNAALRKLMRDMETLRDGAPADPELDRFAGEWRKTAPDPGRLPIVMDKLRTRSVTYAPAALARVDRPVLVVKAGRDALVPPEAFDRLAQAIPGSKSIDFPEGTHGLPRQEAAALAAEIDRFIAAQRPAR